MEHKEPSLLPWPVANPQGHGQWSLRLLADKAVELAFVEEISHEQVRKILKKTKRSTPDQTALETELVYWHHHSGFLGLYGAYSMAV